MSELFNMQNSFLLCFAKLVIWLNEQGYQVTEGEGLRTKEQAEYYASKGMGISNSLHCDKLAHDLNIFKDGSQDIDWKRIGDTWKAMDSRACWGGDFTGKTSGDYGHFSFGYLGRK